MAGDDSRVLLVGHCAADSAGLTRAVREAAPGARVERVNSGADLEGMLGGARLVLVNRVLDGAFETESGVELIRTLKASDEGAGVPAMLVSNFASAQEEAEAAGALPGFGKSSVRDPSTSERIRSALDA